MSGAAPKAPAYWYDGAPVPLHARALAGVYGRAIALRRGLYARGLLRTTRVAAPVVVVGNLVAGGSGKTPLVMALVDRLQRAGWTPGVASRGYGRRHAGTPAWVEGSTDPALGGDEPVLIAQRSGCRVRVDVDRVAAARALVAAGCDVVVCDDGLQHYALARDIEIEVIDGVRGYGNGRLIPAGPLREPAARAALCDFRVVNRGVVGGAASAAEAVACATSAVAADEDNSEPGFGQWPMHVLATEAVPMRGVRPVALDSFAGTRVHAVAGLGDPERFFAMLRALDIAVVPHAFADHHAYLAADLHFGSDLPVLATEKDAVKILALGSAMTLGNRWYRVPIDARLPEAFWIALLARLQALRVAPA